jgi:probable phosphoglycerate mutase
MTTSELYLIRHGESEMNTNPHVIGGRSNETPLTERGVEQARLLGKYFLENNIIPTHVFASPAIRTIQTAKNTLEAMQLNIEPVIADDIQEMDQGSNVGRLRTEVYTPEVLLEIDVQGKDFKLPGGESMNDVGARMLNWVEQNVPASTNSEIDRTFVFGHGVAIKTLASTLHDWSRQETYESVTDNTSFTVFHYEEDRWQLQTLGSTPHLNK